MYPKVGTGWVRGQAVMETPAISLYYSLYDKEFEMDGKIEINI